MEFKLPWRKAGLLISMIQWIRTSRLSIKNSLAKGHLQKDCCEGPDREDLHLMPVVMSFGMHGGGEREIWRE